MRSLYAYMHVCQCPNPAKFQANWSIFIKFSMNDMRLEATPNVLLPNFLQEITQSEKPIKITLNNNSSNSNNNDDNKCIKEIPKRTNKNTHTNLSRIRPKYTIKCKSPRNFIYCSFSNNNFPVVGAVNNVERLHTFFKCIQRSENTGNIINHMNASTANTKHQSFFWDVIVCMSNWLPKLIHFSEKLVTSYKYMMCNILNSEDLSYTMVEACNLTSALYPLQNITSN